MLQTVTISRIIGEYADVKLLTALSLLSKDDRHNFQSAWMLRLKHHFPTTHAEIIKNRTEAADVDWQRIFYRLCQNKYHSWDARQEHLIFSMHDADIGGLTDLVFADFNGVCNGSYYLDIKPHLIVRAEKSQHVLDYLYRRFVSWYQAGEICGDNEYRLTLLHWAIYCNQPLTTIKDMVLHGADIHIERRGLDAVGHAVLDGNLALVQYFVENCGVDIHNFRALGYTLLMLAVFHQRQELVDYLLAMNANVHAVCDSGTVGISMYRDQMHNSILDIAVSKNNFPIIDALCKAGATSNYPQTYAGMTPLHRVAQIHNLQLMEYFLVNRPEYIHVKNKDQATPMTVYLAKIKSKPNDLVGYRLLRTHGAIGDIGSLYKMICDGKAPLAIVEDLISSGLPFDCVDARGNSLLHIAARNRRADIVEFLIQQYKARNADWQPDCCVNARRVTVFAFALAESYAENFAVIKILLEHGANPQQIVISHHISALEYAIKKHFIYITDLLLNYRACINVDIYKLALQHNDVYMVRRCLGGSLYTSNTADNWVHNYFNQDQRRFDLFEKLCKYTVELLNGRRIDIHGVIRFHGVDFRPYANAATLLMRALLYLDDPEITQDLPWMDGGNIYSEYKNLINDEVDVEYHSYVPNSSTNGW